MALLGLVPVLFGVVLALVVLRVKDLLHALALGTGLGVAFFLLPVNALGAVVPLGTAAGLTVGLQGAVAIGLLLCGHGRIRLRPLAPADAAGSLLLAGGVAVYTLFWLFRYLDDDYFVHTALIGLFRAGYFPPTNPFFPDLRIHGHYGRDLTIAALSSLTGISLFPMLYAVATVCHAATALLLWRGARALLHSTRAAALVAVIVFLAVQVLIGGEGPKAFHRFGLIEAVTNNNPVVHLLFFALLLQYVPSVRRRSWWPVVLLGAILGVFALVYETHFGVLACAFLAFPVLLSVLRRRWEGRWLRRTLALLVLAGGIAALQGGPVTEVVRARLEPLLGRAAAVGPTAAEGDAPDFVTQRVTIGFPKHPFACITTGPDTHVPVYTLDFWRSQGGRQFWLFPVSLFVVLWRRSSLGILGSLLGILFLFFPACVDFGAFNQESLRLLFGAGIGCGIALAVLIAEAFDRLDRRPWGARAVTAVAVALLLGPSLGGQARRTGTLLGQARNRAQLYSVAPQDLILSYVRELDPEDWPATGFLQGHAAKGDRLIANLSETETTVHATLIGLSGCPLAGAGVSRSRDPAVGDRFHVLGYRGRAFWNTLDPDLADQLALRWVYVAVERLPEPLRERLRSDGAGYRLAFATEGGPDTARREIYERLRGSAAGSGPDAGAAATLRIEELRLPADLRVESFQVADLVLSNPGAQVIRLAGTRLRQRIVDLESGRRVNAGDELRQPVRLELAPGQRATVALWLVTPFEAGRYRLELALEGPGGARDLEAGPQAQLTLAVR